MEHCTNPLVGITAVAICIGIWVALFISNPVYFCGAAVLLAVHGA